MIVKHLPWARRKTTFLNISSPTSWPRVVFVVHEQENIINRVPAYERLVTGKKRRNPHEVTNLMKNTGNHNGYLRFEHEANGGKKLWQTMKIRVNQSSIVSTSKKPIAGWMSAKNSIQTTTATLRCQYICYTYEKIFQNTCYFIENYKWISQGVKLCVPWLSSF